MSAANKRTRRSVVVRGTYFPSLAAAARQYGKPEKLFRKRMLSGLTPEQALELEPFPDWFVPGKGQCAKARRAHREIIDLALGTRRCCVCKERRSLSEFHKQKGEKLSYRCRHCTAAALIKTRYGLELDAFNAMAEQQQWSCAICRTPLAMQPGSPCRDKSVAVDHCHQTGEVRGILCNMCNVGLGSFADSTARLAAAINYLRQSNSGSLAPC